MESGLDPAFSAEAGADGLEGVSSPRCGRTGRGLAAMSCVLLPTGCCPPCAGLLRLPPPTRSRCSQFDGRPLCSDGGGEDTPVDCSVQQSGSLEDFCSSTFSTASKSRPSLSAISWHVQSPATLSGISLTSKVRPSMRLATVLCVYTVASGSVSASVHNGGSPDLRLDGCKREGLDCFVVSFSEVFSSYIRNPSLFFPSDGVLCKIMYCHGF
jgi:hypothetical protein